MNWQELLTGPANKSKSIMLTDSLNHEATRCAKEMEVSLSHWVRLLLADAIVKHGGESLPPATPEDP